MTTELDMVRRTRRYLKDSPLRSFVMDNPLDPTETLLQLPGGGAALFPQPGITIEFDDETAEVAVTTGSADATNDTVPIFRGQDGTTASTHELNTAVFINPKYGYSSVAEAVNFVVDTELWPFVWVVGETSLTPNFASDHYPGLAGVEEVIYGYQIQAGYNYFVSVDWLSPTEGDNVNYPNGAFLIQPSFVDSSSVYVSFRARATLTTLSASLEHLVALGASGHLLMLDEAALVSADVGFVERGLQEGSRSRAGLLLWQRFEQARSRENISLLHEEDQRRRVWHRQGV